MQAVILNSGLGSRLNNMTRTTHKSLLKIDGGKSLLEHQIELLIKNRVNEIFITTGHMADKVENLILQKFPNINIKFIYNDKYEVTNYIYSMYLVNKYIEKDVLLMHGDLYYEDTLLKKIIENKKSCGVIEINKNKKSKDFRCLLNKENIIKKIDVNLKDDRFLFWPLYKLKLEDWKLWLNRISDYIKVREFNVYAENALNDVLNNILLEGIYLKGEICMEVDTKKDLFNLREIIIRRKTI